MHHMIHKCLLGRVQTHRKITVSNSQRGISSTIAVKHNLVIKVHIKIKTFPNQNLHKWKKIYRQKSKIAKLKSIFSKEGHGSN